MIRIAVVGVGALGQHHARVCASLDGATLAGVFDIDAKRAAEVATISGSLEIGQGAISCAGLILAVEAQEGTDRMLARIPDLPVEIRGTAEARRGVLVKRPKPQQERRIDLPTIGVATVRGAAAAGLAGIAVEAGAALVVDRGDVAAAADQLGLFIYGFTIAELGAEPA